VSRVQFRVLGPLEVVDGERMVSLPQGKERALLAILLVNANAVVSRDRLIDALWGAQPPETAPTALHGLVSQLRRHLGAEADDQSREGLVVTQPPGYLIRIEQGQLDLDEFERLVDKGRNALIDGSAAEAALLFGRALELWRGPALEGVDYENFAQPEVARLQEERLMTIEDRNEAELALGRHAQLVGELTELVAQHPLRERLRGQLMLALYRCGRQADALGAYQDGRRILQRQLGIAPGPELRQLERAILHQDPELGRASKYWLRAARSRWRKALAGALAVAASASVVVVALGGFRSSDATVAIVPHSIAVIDATKNAVVDDIPVGGYPGPVTAGAGSVWVSNIADATISRIDPRTHRVVGTNGLTRALDLAVRGVHLWAANGGDPGHATRPPGTVLQFHLATARTRTIRVGPRVAGGEEQTTIALGENAVWVGNQESSTVRRIDLATGKTLATIKRVFPGGVGAGRSGVWASDPRRGRIVHIDPSTNRVVGTVAIPGRPTRLVVGDHAVWVTTRVPNSAVWRVDSRTSRVVATIPIRGTPARIAVGAGAVWVTSFEWTSKHVAAFGGLVTRIDPRANRVVAEIRVGDRADGLAVAAGLVWVAVGPRR
jgi:DNA-binding SARP family transcriptional activator